MAERKAPAFQEYAASMLAHKNFRTMTLAERGLLFTLRLECWENATVPSDTQELARYLGFHFDEIRSSFTEKVKSFFEMTPSKNIFFIVIQY